MCLRDEFLLDQSMVFLNHGSFGACPRPVLEEYQRWQLELERRPVEFLARRRRGLLDEARAALAVYVGARAEDLVFVPNATTAMNTVARSLSLEPGDEVLTTEHEYGAIVLAWEATGARVVQAPLESLWEHATGRTKVLSLSHVTSPTALVVPVEEHCRRARGLGIVSVVDGAHGPGQVPVDVAAMGADLYAGNCHKWLCAPKGSGFLWAREELQGRIDPLVVSWDWPEREFTTRHFRQGTRDPAAWLAVPAAIEFQRGWDWDKVRARCHALADEFVETSGLDPVGGPFAQMVSVELPPCDPEELQRRLRGEHAIEVPCLQWNGRPLLRLSVQGYNTEEDLGRLVDALGALL